MLRCMSPVVGTNRTNRAALTMSVNRADRKWLADRQCRLRQGMLRVRLAARRMPPLAPQVSQIGNSALVEREAITWPLDHAFGFELAM